MKHPGPDAADHRARILIVDDEEKDRRLLEVILEPEGYDLVTAVTGEEALTIVAQQPFDLIVLDVMLPGINGYQVAAIIKGDLATKNIPVVVVSSLADREARMLGLNAGAEDFVTKPVDRAELCVRVRNLVRLKAYGDYYDKYSHALEEVSEACRKANEELTASRARLKAYATDLETKVEARTALLHTQATEIEALYLRSEEASRLRSETIANLSHELRTPLTAIIGYHELLEDELPCHGSDDARRTLHRLHGQSERLRSVLESLLTLAQLRNGVVGTNVSRFTCTALLDDLRADAVRLNIDKGLEFEWRSPSAQVELGHDREKIRVIGYHLLSNAIKFTHVGCVVVTVASADGGLTLTVADPGVGVPPDARQFIFDDFRQLDGSSTRRFEGLGLGLGIVTRYTALLDGKLAIESTPGVGTTIRVDLPAPRVTTKSRSGADAATTDRVGEKPS